MYKTIRFTCLFAGMLGFIGCGESTKPEKQQLPAPQVTVAKPVLEKLTSFTELTGVLDSPNLVQLRARVSGYIDEVKFRDGQEVKAGDPLFQIDRTTYAAELEIQEARLKSTQAKMREADAEEKRSKLALNSRAISQQEYESYAAKLSVAQADVLGAEAAVKVAKQNLEWTVVTSPIAGKVDRAYLTKGNVATGGITQGTVLTTIVSIDPIYAFIDVDDQTVLFFQRLYAKEKSATPSTEKVTTTVGLQLQGEKGYPHSGEIDFVSNRINPTTGSLQVRATVPNPDRLLLPGRYFRARVPLGKPYDALLIPEDAILTDQGQKVVYTMDAAKKVVAKPVKTGPMERGLRVILSGLTADEEILIKGLQRVRPGVTVEPQSGTITPKPVMNPES